MYNFTSEFTATNGTDQSTEYFSNRVALNRHVMKG